MKKLFAVFIAFSILVLSFHVSSFAAQAQKWIIDADQGADLKARLADIHYADGDTLVFRGLFSAEEIILSERVTVKLVENTLVYGNMTFPRGGSLVGKGDESLQVIGNVYTAGTLLVSDIRIEGTVWAGSPDPDDPETDAELRIAGAFLLDSRNESPIYSDNDIVVLIEAMVAVTGQDASFDQSVIHAEKNVLIGESAEVSVWGVGALHNTISASCDVIIGEGASTKAYARGEGCAIRADTVAVGKNAYVVTQADGDYGLGIRTRVFNTGAGAHVYVQTPLNGINFTRGSEDEEGEEKKTISLSIDPATVIDAPSFLFSTDYHFSELVTFEYWSEEPPTLRKEWDSNQVTGHRENYKPVQQLSDGDSECFGMPIEDY